MEVVSSDCKQTGDNPMQQDTITVKEAAQRLGIGINQAYEAFERGQIPCVRFGKRWLIPLTAFERWLLDCHNRQSVDGSGVDS